MLDWVRKCLWLAAFAGMSCGVSAQTRETIVSGGSEDALRVWMSSLKFSISTFVVNGGPDEPSCAAGALKTMREMPRFFDGRLHDSTTVAGHTGRSLMLVLCMATDHDVQAHVVVASDNATEVDQLKRLSEYIRPASRSAVRGGETRFNRQTAASSNAPIRTMGFHVSFKAHRNMTASRCSSEVRQAMSKAGLSRLRTENDLVIGTNDVGIAVAACVPFADQTKYRLAVFGSEDRTAVELFNRVTALLPGRPGEKPEILLGPNVKAQIIRRPTP